MVPVLHHQQELAIERCVSFSITKYFNVGNSMRFRLNSRERKRDFVYIMKPSAKSKTTFSQAFAQCMLQNRDNRSISPDTRQIGRKKNIVYFACFLKCFKLMLGRNLAL